MELESELTVSPALARPWVAACAVKMAANAPRRARSQRKGLR
jgi:hypothetical protein